MSSASRTMTNVLVKKLCFCLALSAFLTLGVSGAANAHPHVWVTVKSKVLYGADGMITGIRQHWKFDEFYSSFAIQGLDKDEDGKFSKDELAELAKVNVTSLSEYDYFTFPKKGDQAVEMNEPTDYWLEHHEDGTLTLHFTLPLKQPASASSEKFSFTVYDPTFYISFEFDKKDAVVLAAGAPSNCAAKLFAPKKQQQQTAALNEAFSSDAGGFQGLAVQLAQDAVVSCSK